MNEFHYFGSALFIHRFHPAKSSNFRKAEQGIFHLD